MSSYIDLLVLGILFLEPNKLFTNVFGSSTNLTCSSSMGTRVFFLHENFEKNMPKWSRRLGQVITTIIIDTNQLINH